MKRLSIVFFLVAGIASASEVPAHTLAVYRQGKKPSVVDLGSAYRLTTIRSKTPHRQLNPDGKTFEFQGIDIVALLRLTSADKALLVHFVGVDGFTSVVPASVLLRTKAILAMKQDGHTLVEREGGLQVVFPTDGDRAVEERYAKKAAFWCWYVRSIVVGDLPNAMPISNWHLNSIRKVAVPLNFEPPSVFQFEKTKCPKAIRVPLARFSQTGAATIELLSSARKTIDPKKFDLVLSDSHVALPVECGGPFALIDRSKLSAANEPLLGKDLELSVVKIQ